MDLSSVFSEVHMSLSGLGMLVFLNIPQSLTKSKGCNKETVRGKNSSIGRRNNHLVKYAFHHFELVAYKKIIISKKLYCRSLQTWHHNAMILYRHLLWTFLAVSSCFYWPNLINVSSIKFWPYHPCLCYGVDMAIHAMEVFS